MYTDRKTQCVICWKKIDFNKDKYVRMTDFTGRKQDGEVFHHLDCWMNKFKITQEKINEQANEWMDKIKNLDLSKFGGSNEPAYKRLKTINK